MSRPMSRTVVKLPVLGEAKIADRFLTSLPSPTGRVGKQALPMSMQEARASRLE
jgi:hypothetical protein